MQCLQELGGNPAGKVDDTYRAGAFCAAAILLKQESRRKLVAASSHAKRKSWHYVQPHAATSAAISQPPLHAFAPSAKNLKVGSRDVKLVEAWSFVSYVGTNFVHHKFIKIATTVEVATSDSSFSAVSKRN